jgi:hypothetical protein
MKRFVLTLTALLLAIVSACAAQSLGEAARQARKEKQPAAHVFTNENLPTDAPISVTGQPATPPAEAGDKGAAPSADKAADDKSSGDKPAAGKAASDKAADNKAANDDKAKGDKTADDKPSKAAEDKSDKAADKAEKSDKTAAADDKSAADRSTTQSVEDQADGEDKSDDSAAASRQKLMDEWKSKFAKQRQEIHLSERELDVLVREYRLRAAAFYADAGNRLRNQEQWSREDQQYSDRIAQKQKQLDDSKQTLEDMKEQARKEGMPSSVAEPQ